MTEKQLHDFVLESNRIEGIYYVTQEDLRATGDLMSQDEMSTAELSKYVYCVAGAKLRHSPKDNVRVGGHVPPPGGPHILECLRVLVDRANAAADPWRVHVDYETLHPFMDGNGRSGRALWAWQMLKLGRERFLEIGFLHEFYYQTLDRSDGRKR